MKKILSQDYPLKGDSRDEGLEDSPIKEVSF